MDKDKSNKILKMLLNILVTLLALIVLAVATYFIYKNVKENIETSENV